MKCHTRDIGKRTWTRWRLSSTHANKITGLAPKREKENKTERERENEREESETQEPRGSSRQRDRDMNERTYVVRDTENGGGA